MTELTNSNLYKALRNYEPTNKDIEIFAMVINQYQNKINQEVQWQIDMAEKSKSIEYNI